MTNVGRLLRAKIDEEVRKLQGELGEGLARDMADYRYMTGIIHGFHTAVRLLDEVEEEGR